ncbi:MAG: SMC-Scp complex subunit ScpB [Candidatus Lokiarchaeota archaeon]|nr:SMC-Scp complex subunit ScpB [Candidatus Lokiarchaeota archaeon]MBD3198677.1 SMC-Scp complex subunit ScpB [Candidatus Lokiarchaeota archaeon]
MTSDENITENSEEEKELEDPDKDHSKDELNSEKIEKQNNEQISEDKKLLKDKHHKNEKNNGSLITDSFFESGQDHEVEIEEFEGDKTDIYRNLIEGALYASGSALSIEEIATKLDISKKEVGGLLVKLIEMYTNRSTALEIIQVGDKYQMQIKSAYSEKISQFAKGGAIAEKYLRTLTIIALKQPLLKSTLVKIRGTGAYEHVKYLEENELIDSVKKGRTSELTTTDKYAEMFGLPKNKVEMKKVMIEQLGIQDQ